MTGAIRREVQDLPRLVVLPGLDGTGLLLADFVRAVSAFFRVQVIAYPVDEPLSYDELMLYVQSRLPDEPLWLIGESFSFHTDFSTVIRWTTPKPDTAGLSIT